MSRFVLLALIVALVVGLTVAVFMTPGPVYPVQGSVYLCSSAYGDLPGGVPIVGVTVTFNGAYPAISDFNGKYSLSLPAGSYAVHGELTGYVPFDGTLVVDGPEIYNQVCLTPLVGR